MKLNRDDVQSQVLAGTAPGADCRSFAGVQFRIGGWFWCIAAEMNCSNLCMSGVVLARSHPQALLAAGGRTTTTVSSSRPRRDVC